MVNRSGIVSAARSWVATPYHHMARAKGIGVDCGQLVIAALAEAGEIEEFDTGHYTCDWHLHRDEDRYLELVERYLRRIEGDEDLSIDHRLSRDPLWAVSPGDIIVFKVGRCFSHGAIVTDWPNIVHSYLPAEMVEEVSIVGTPMSYRVCRVYTREGMPK